MTRTKNAYSNICVVYNIKVGDTNHKQSDKYNSGAQEIDEAEIERRQNELAMVMHNRYVDW